VKRDEADAKLNAYYDGEAEEEDDVQREQLEEEAYALNDQVDTFGERLETWADDDMKLGGVFITIDQDGDLNIERGLVKREDVARVYPKDGAGDDEGDMATTAPQPKEKPLHGEKLCRRLTAHRTAAVQAELSRRPVVALAALMNRLIPTVFDERYRFAYAESALKIDAHTSRDALVREADDMESSVAFTQIEADRVKWAKLLPKDLDDLLPWLLKQETDVMASLFAFCVAATLDGVSSTDRVHPINALANVMQIDMACYWKPTQQSYLNHVSKARIIDVVTEAQEDALTPHKPGSEGPGNTFRVAIRAARFSHRRAARPPSCKPFSRVRPDSACCARPRARIEAHGDPRRRCGESADPERSAGAIRLGTVRHAGTFSAAAALAATSALPCVSTFFSFSRSAMKASPRFLSVRCKSSSVLN
jgi:hypothetical protein